MQLIRILQITLDASLASKLSIELIPINGIIPSVLVSQRREEGQKVQTYLYVYTQRKADSPVLINPEGVIQLDREVIRLLEEPIEVLGRLLAVHMQCKWDIFSVGPHLAFIPESEEELDWLKKSRGIPGTKKNISIDLRVGQGQMTADLIRDRRDGLFLISEALSHNHATGKYHEIVRLFEAAFRLPLQKLEKKLAQFLKTGGMGYERQEIKEWISLRHAATHADREETDYLVMESDVLPVIERMMQATYDVFFNKSEWGNNSSERRTGIKFDSISTASSSTGEVNLGKTVPIKIEVRDPFGSYRCDSDLKPGLLPKSWWYKVQSSAGEGSVFAR